MTLSTIAMKQHKFLMSAIAFAGMSEYGDKSADDEQECPTSPPANLDMMDNMIM